jgi:hypothetical protein
MHDFTCHSCTIHVTDIETATLFINDDNELSVEYIVEQTHEYQGTVKDTADVGITNFYYIVKHELENKRVTTQFTTEFCILQVDFECDGFTVKYKLFLPCHSKKIYGLTENAINFDDEYETNEKLMNNSLSRLLQIPFPSDSETSSCNSEATCDYVAITKRKCNNNNGRNNAIWIDFGVLGVLLQRLLKRNCDKPRMYDIAEQVMIFGIFMSINSKFTMDRLLAVFKGINEKVVFDGLNDCVKKWIVEELHNGLASAVFDKEFL